MSAVKITDRLTVASQPDIGAIADLAKDYATLINLRPNGEDAAQPGNDAEHAAATSAKLGYAFVPVSGSTLTEADIRAFQHAMNTADGPVYAHCKGGTRVLTLYTLGEVLDGRMRREDVEAFGKDRGFDLSGAVRWLARQAAYKPVVKGFYDSRSGSIQYVVSDPATRRCAIIDPVHDFDEKSGATATTHADAILAYIKNEGLTVEWIFDTHPHADHFSAAHYLKTKTGAPTAIGAHITDVQKLWKAIYNWPALATDGSQWDRLFNHGDTFRIGTIEGRVLFSPGHTLASITYAIGDAAFVHDTLFMPDSGTARTDFPGGSAKTLWASMQQILALPDDTRLFTGHDYQPHGRHARWESTVGEQKRANPHIAGIDEAAFIQLREARNKILPMPKLILHALQVNINGGRLPEPESNGRRYLKFPLDALEGLGMVSRTGATARILARPMDMEANANEAAALLKTLSHPGRLALACALTEGEYSVGALEERVGIHQPSLSQQLGILRDAGVVKTRREAKQIFYRLTEAKAAQLIEALHTIYCGKGKRR